ncbi:MAG: SIS domain-containing protein [Pseudomonadota bacterium]
MGETVTKAFKDIAALVADVANDKKLQAGIDQAAEMALSALARNGKLFFAGNGGSAAEAQHLAAEYVSRFKFDRPGLPAIALTTDTSALTAIGNDYGFDAVFQRQIEALARPSDLIFLSSTSGRSPNILAAISAARRLCVPTVLLTGAGYVHASDGPDLVLTVPSSETARIQEIHLMIGHSICEIVELRIFGA